MEDLHVLSGRARGPQTHTLSGLVGRRVEMDLLHRALDEAITHRSTKVVVLSGEAGMGKTRLLHEFLTQASGRPDHAPICGYGQALSVSVAAEAFGAVRECLRSIAATGASSTSTHRQAIGEALRQSAPAWLEAIPMVGQLLSAGIQTGQALSQARSGPVIDLTSPVDQFMSFISSLGNNAPVVLILDDLHWADNATVELVMRLALQSSGPLLLVLSYRVNPGAALNAADRAILDARNNILRYRADAVALDLQRLSDQALVEALANRDGGLGQNLAPENLRRIVSLSGGNPLLAECLLLAEGESDLSGMASAASPERIGAIMDIGLGRLDPADAQFLEACAAVGPIFDAEDVARAVRATADDVIELIDSLDARASLIDDVPGPLGSARYTFHHPILAEVLRDRAREQFNRWRRINARLVEGAPELGDEDSWDAALLARMAGYAVEAQRNDEAFRWALAASQKQLEWGSSSTARETARAAIGAAQTDEQRLRARMVLIECLHSYADHDQVVEECELALADLRSLQTSPPPGLVPEAVFGQGLTSLASRIRLQRLRGLRMTGEWSQVATDLPLLIDESRADSPKHYALAMLLLAETQLCGPKQDLEGCQQTLHTLLELPLDAATHSRTVGHLGLAALARHEVHEAERHLDEAIAFGSRSGRALDVYEAIHWKSKKQMACLELDAAVASIRQLQELSERHGIAADTPFHDRDLSRVMGLMGKPADAAPLCVRYVDSSGSPDGVVLATLAFQVAELNEIRGLSDAHLLMTSFLELAPGNMYDNPRRELSGRMLRMLLDQTDLLAIVRDPEALGASAEEYRQAYDIFTFNVPRLNRLRETHA